MARKKKHEEHENMERWLVSYADFITMLFCFFTFLYSQAPKDDIKMKIILQGVRDAFNSGARMDILELLDLMRLSTENPFELPIELNKVHITPELQAIQEIPIDRIGTDGSLTNNVVEIGLTEQDLVLAMPEKFLFSPGSTELPVAAFGWLAAIAESVADMPADMQIIGHADGTPIPVGGRFEDNWSLAGARAAQAVRYLEDKGVPPDRMTLIGRVTEGADPEERAISIKIHMEDPAAATEVLTRIEQRGLGQFGAYR